MDSNQVDGEPAFPRGYRYDGHNGMSLRDYFAAKAMQGDIASMASEQDPSEAASTIAVRAYQVADAMLKARSA